VFRVCVYIGVLERRLDPRLRGAAAAAAASPSTKKIRVNSTLQNALLEDNHWQAVGEDTAEDSSVKDEVQTRKRSDSVTSECSLHIEDRHARKKSSTLHCHSFYLTFRKDLLHLSIQVEGHQ